MEAFFRDSPIIVLGKMFVLPIEQDGQEAIHGESNAKTIGKVACFDGRREHGDERQRPEIGESFDGGMQQWDVPLFYQESSGKSPWQEDVQVYPFSPSPSRRSALPWKMASRSSGVMSSKSTAATCMAGLHVGKSVAKRMRSAPIALTV